MTLAEKCRTLADNANIAIKEKNRQQTDYLWEHYFIPTLTEMARLGNYAYSFDCCLNKDGSAYLLIDDKCCSDPLLTMNFDLDYLRTLVEEEGFSMEVYSNMQAFCSYLTISWPPLVQEDNNIK